MIPVANKQYPHTTAHDVSSDTTGPIGCCTSLLFKQFLGAIDGNRYQHSRMEDNSSMLTPPPFQQRPREFVLAKW